MLSKQKSRYALEVMGEMFPQAQCELVHQNVFELLIATILSAQATDVSVNKVTPVLFAAYPRPEQMAGAPLEDLMGIINSIGLYRNKSKNIKAASQLLLDNFDGEVPRTRQELMSLPGVGRKTANVVLSVGFGIPALAVDTHVERVAKRLRMVPQKASVLEVEKQLMQKLPEEMWGLAHHRLIFFGRYHCTARNPKCEVCPLLSICADGQKRLGIKIEKKESGPANV